MCVCKQQPRHMHGLPVLCKQARRTWLTEILVQRAALGLGGFGLCHLLGKQHVEAVTLAAKHPMEQRGTPSPGPLALAPSSPQLGAALIGHLCARIRVGKQNHSSEHTAERGQRKLTSDTVVPLALPARISSRCTDASAGCTSPGPLTTRQWSEEEPAASTVQLPPELLRQRAADPNPAQMLFNSSMNTIGSHKSSPNGNSHNVLESKHYKKAT